MLRREVDSAKLSQNANDKRHNTVARDTLSVLLFGASDMDEKISKYFLLLITNYFGYSVLFLLLITIYLENNFSLQRKSRDVYVQ